jgi:hypothetical protein
MPVAGANDTAPGAENQASSVKNVPLLRVFDVTLLSCTHSLGPLPFILTRNNRADQRQLHLPTHVLPALQ